MTSFFNPKVLSGAESGDSIQPAQMGRLLEFGGCFNGCWTLRAIHCFSRFSITINRYCVSSFASNSVVKVRWIGIVVSLCTLRTRLYELRDKKASNETFALNSSCLGFRMALIAFPSEAYAILPMTPSPAARAKNMMMS